MTCNNLAHLFITYLAIPVQRLNRYARSLLWPLVVFGFIACGALERDNPYDPANRQIKDNTAISLYLPLSKPLARVISHIEAILEGPGMRTITTELTYTALGPAQGTIGAIPPGTDRTLIIRGYDLDGNLLFSGQQSSITISVGDTTQVNLNLELVGNIPSLPLDTADNTSDTSSENPAEETAENPTEETAENPTEETSENPTEETAENPTEE